MNQEVLLSDLAAMADKMCLSETDPNLWKPVSYRTELCSGRMLGCGSGPAPVPIAIKLGLRGQYRIHAGIYSFGNMGGLRLRLSGDVCSRLICAPGKAQGIGPESLYITELFWKEADLTDQELIVEAEYKQAEQTAGLAYLRLEPTGEPAAASQRPVKFPMTFTNDGHGIFGLRPHHRPEDLLEPFERFGQDSCVRTLLWGIGDGDICNYPTNVGSYFLAEDTYANPFRRTLHGNMATWKKNGWDSLKVVCEYAKRRNWELQAYIRMESFDAPFPFDRFQYSEFYHRHPEYHCLDRDGQRVMRLSYAFSEVQSHMLDLIGEIAGYDVDGVSLSLVRGVPLVLYEKPMVHGFIAKYGTDPRTLPETDERWWAYQAEVFTPFVRNAKARLRRGQRLSVMVPANEIDCRRWGLDVAAWVKEGLIDDLYPVGQRFDDMDVHRDDPKTLDFDFFNRLEGRDRIRLIPLLYPWDTFQSDYTAWRNFFFSYLDRGADGYAVWDALEHGDLSRFDLGYEDRRQTEPATPEYRSVKLLELEGFRFDRYHHFEVI